MKSTKIQNNQGYSIIIAVLTIGFLLVLTTTTLNLSIQEMFNGKGNQDYMKAYSAAEGWLELALLKIKENGYGYYGELSDAKILWEWTKDPIMSYSFDSRVKSFSWSIEAYQNDIIPLFSIWDSGEIIPATQLLLDAPNDLGWNIIWDNSWLSGIWAINKFTAVWKKELEISWNPDFSFSASQSVQDFISSNSWSYLQLKNSTDTTKDYILSSWDDYITKPRAIITSSAKLWKYTQNLETKLDNTQFLGILEYSIYSWN